MSLLIVAATLPEASISSSPLPRIEPIAAMRPSATAMSAWKRGARVPSTTVAFRMSRE